MSQRTWDLLKGKDGPTGEDIFSSLGRKLDLLTLVISYMLLPKTFGKLRKAKVII